MIACNDDALKSIKLILEELTKAIVSKKKELNVYFPKEEKDSSSEQEHIGEEINE